MAALGCAETQSGLGPLPEGPALFLACVLSPKRRPGPILYPGLSLQYIPILHFLHGLAETRPNTELTLQGYHSASRGPAFPLPPLPRHCPVPSPRVRLTRWPGGVTLFCWVLTKPVPLPAGTYLAFILGNTVQPDDSTLTSGVWEGVRNFCMSAPRPAHKTSHSVSPSHSLDDGKQEGALGCTVQYGATSHL